MSKHQKTIDHYFNQANDFFTKGHDAPARALLLQIISLDQCYSNAHRALAISYAEHLQNDQALTHSSMWFMTQPTNPEARWIHGMILFRLSRFNDALKILTPLTKTHPNWPNLSLVMGKCYLDLRQLEQGEAFFEHAIELTSTNPIENAKARWEYAMQLLTQGDYKRGWKHHEARLLSLGWENLHLSPIPLPAWNGEPLDGKSIVVHGEQGIGDEIMYASMLPDLINRGAKITLACYPALYDLMRTSFPTIHVVKHPRGSSDVEQWKQGKLPTWWYELLASNGVIDYQIPMGSLANLLRTETSSFSKTPYLNIDDTRRENMRATLFERAQQQGINLEGKHLIALAWCGNLDNPHGRAKSIDLENLTGLGKIAEQNNVVFISLQNRQYGHQALNALEQKIMTIVDMSPYTDDFTDTLALASLCQHVITIDTSYAHLCGAAGLSTLLLLRRNCDWRWGWLRSESDWYRTIELTRQEIDGDWHNVIQYTQEKLLNWLTSN